MAKAHSNPFGLSNTTLALGAVGLAGVGYLVYQNYYATTEEDTLSDEDLTPEDAVNELTATASDTIQTTSGPLKPAQDLQVGTTDRADTKIKDTIKKWWKSYRTPSGVKVSVVGTYKITKVLEPKKTRTLYTSGPDPVAVTVNKGSDKIVLLRVKVPMAEGKVHSENLYIVVKPNTIKVLGQELLRKAPTVEEVSTEFTEELERAEAGPINAHVHVVASGVLNFLVSEDKSILTGAPASTPWVKLRKERTASKLAPSAFAYQVRDALITLVPDNREIVQQALDLLREKEIISIMPSLGKKAKRNEGLAQSAVNAAPILVPLGTAFLVDRFVTHGEDLMIPSIAGIVAALATYYAVNSMAPETTTA